MKTKRMAVLDFIWGYREHNGYSPTHREIAEALGMSGTAVRDHLLTLEHLGYIQRGERGKDRNIVAVRLPGMPALKAVS